MPVPPSAIPLRYELVGAQVHTASGALLRERNQLQASTGYVDDMLAQAQSVTKSLLEQRKVFDDVQVIDGWAPGPAFPGPLSGGQIRRGLGGLFGRIVALHRED